MKSVVVRIVALAIAVSCLALSVSSESPFNDFFSKFKAAVMSGNTNQLQDLMSQEFDYMGTTNASPAEVFKGLSAGQWINLQSAVQAGVFTVHPYKERPARLLKCTPATTYNTCYVVFQTDSSGNWRWKAMVMPEK